MPNIDFTYGLKIWGFTVLIGYALLIITTLLGVNTIINVLNIHIALYVIAFSIVFSIPVQFLLLIMIEILRAVIANSQQRKILTCAFVTMAITGTFILLIGIKSQDSYKDIISTSLIYILPALTATWIFE